MPIRRTGTYNSIALIHDMLAIFFTGGISDQGMVVSVFGEDGSLLWCGQWCDKDKTLAFYKSVMKILNPTCCKEQYQEAIFADMVS